MFGAMHDKKAVEIISVLDLASVGIELQTEGVFVSLRLGDAAKVNVDRSRDILKLYHPSGKTVQLSLVYTALAKLPKVEEVFDMDEVAKFTSSEAHAEVVKNQKIAEIGWDAYFLELIETGLRDQGFYWGPIGENPLISNDWGYVYSQCRNGNCLLIKNGHLTFEQFQKMVKVVEPGASAEWQGKIILLKTKYPPRWIGKLGVTAKRFGDMFGCFVKVYAI